MDAENEQNKNANNKVDILYNFWLGRWFAKITVDGLQDDAEIEQTIQEIRKLLDEKDQR